MTRRANHKDDSVDLLSQYLQEISQVPRLTPERERELGYRVQLENDKAAVEELVKANLRFVVSYAKRFRNSQVLFLDLINEGNLGLIQAAKKYDPDKNVKFITYAVWWIRQSILHALSEQGGAFRLPPKRANLMYRLEKNISALMTEENRVPSAEELAESLGISVREVESLLQANLGNFSLNAEYDESHTQLSDMIEQTSVPSAEVEMEEQSLRHELLSQISELSSKERLVLVLRHGVTDNVPKRLSEIGEFLNRPTDEIVLLLRSAMDKICGALEVTESEFAHLLLYTNPNPKASWTYWVALGDLQKGSNSHVDPSRIPILESLKQHGTVQSQMELLPVEELTVLKLRFGVLQDDELTLRDIGVLLNLSRERVRQIEARAEAKCRRVVRRVPGSR